MKCIYCESTRVVDRFRGREAVEGDRGSEGVGILNVYRIWSVRLNSSE